MGLQTFLDQCTSYVFLLLQCSAVRQVPDSQTLQGPSNIPGSVYVIRTSSSSSSSSTVFLLLLLQCSAVRQVLGSQILHEALKHPWISVHSTYFFFSVLTYGRFLAAKFSSNIPRSVYVLRASSFSVFCCTAKALGADCRVHPSVQLE